MSFFSLQSRQFWVVYLGMALVSAAAAFWLMFRFVPFLEVENHFSRAQAIALATKFQHQYFSELETNRTAASFITDGSLQNYVELEGGGLRAYRALLNQLDAVTHYWKVRCFSEGQEKELIMAFSPKGEPISFALKVPDKELGVALAETEARTIAETGARTFMGERFAQYRSLETKIKRQASGRTDYSFTYEHETLKLGDARFRIELKVLGNRLTTLDTFKYIPEAFEQRFGDMRAVNNHISQIASYLMVGLIGLGGLVGGGLWLHRRHQLQWKKGLLPAGIVSCGLAVGILSNLPMTWMSYSTVVSASNFLLQQIAVAGGVMIGTGLLFATLYAIAEGLSRVAFANHIRLFEFFRIEVAASPEVLGRVLGAYGWTGFFLLYAIAFNLITNKYLGWWMPSNLDSDPNILASWRPAFGPIFTALQAGTWEECFFRAVPLSLAVILGKRLGVQKPLVIFVLILQALIFAGAHANYPNLPGYSRLIELFIPAIAFGLVYLRFGLVVGIITHFLYDLILMSLPIFSGHDSSLIIDKALVVIVGISPLLFILYARLRMGAFKPLANEWRNGIPDLNISQKPESDDAANSINPPPFLINLKWIVPFALISVIAIVISVRKQPELIWPMFQIDRSAAEAKAEQQLTLKGVVLEGEWHRSIVTYSTLSSSLDYVWREAGKAETQRLIGRYLDTPFWVVSWKKFDGPVELRSERWEAWLYPDGSLHELVHVLPEATKGEKLTSAQATTKALEWIVMQHWGDSNNLEVKSVDEILKPSRSDWKIKFIDKRALNSSLFAQKDTQAFIQISLSGDEVSGFFRGIEVPEEWQRTEAEKTAKKLPFKIAAMFFMFVIVGLAVSGYFRKHPGIKMNFSAAMPWIVICAGASLLVSLFWLNNITNNFQSTMNWNLQLWLAICGVVLVAGCIGAFNLFMAQAIHGERPSLFTSLKSDALIGFVFALSICGLYSIVALVFPNSSAPVGNAGDIASYMPWITSIVASFKGFLMTAILLVLMIGLVRYTHKPKRQMVLVVVVFVWWLSVGLAANDVQQTLLNQSIQIINLTLLFMLVKRKQIGAAIALTGFTIAFNQFGLARALYSSAWIHASLAAGCSMLLTLWLMKHWYTKGLVK